MKIYTAWSASYCRTKTDIGCHYVRLEIQCISNMKFIWLILVFIYRVKDSEGKGVLCSNAAEGYYWRDYKGVIPSDGLPAGKDEREQATFIGQVLHPGGHLTPGVIRRGSNQVFYEFGNKALEAEEDVKILCSQHPEQLVWLHVKTKESIFNINGTELIIAGHDNKGPLSIGRKVVGPEIVVGKVLLVGYEFAGFWYATNREHNYVDDSYEVLVFDSKAVVGEHDIRK